MKNNYLIFSLNNEKFGVDSSLVFKIIKNFEINRIPGLPDFIKGICDVYNNVVPVIDLKKRFSFPHYEEDEKMYLLVIILNNCYAGILVDSVIGIKQFNNIFEKKSNSHKKFHKDYIKEIYKLNNKFFTIIDFDICFSEIEGKLVDILSGINKENSSETDFEENTEYLTFSIREQKYGIKILKCVEIIKNMPMSKPPQLNDLFCGHISLRNNEIPVIDLIKSFTMSPSINNRKNKIIIVEFSNCLIGFLVESVNDLKRVIKDKNNPEVNNINDKFPAVKSVDNDLFFVVEPEYFLNDKSIEYLKKVNNQALIEEKCPIKTVNIIFFKIFDQVFGLEYFAIKEIIKFTELMKNNNRSKFLDGILRLRNEFVNVYNLRKLFGIDRTASQNKKIIVCRKKSSLLGFTVDNVLEVQEINTAEIDTNIKQDFSILTSERSYEIKKIYINGILKFKHTLAVILDFEKLCADIQ